MSVCEKSEKFPRKEIKARTDTIRHNQVNRTLLLDKVFIIISHFTQLCTKL